MIALLFMTQIHSQLLHSSAKRCSEDCSDNPGKWECQSILSYSISASAYNGASTNSALTFLENRSKPFFSVLKQEETSGLGTLATYPLEVSTDLHRSQGEALGAGMEGKCCNSGYDAQCAMKMCCSAVPDVISTVVTANYLHVLPLIEAENRRGF